jgi:hypothetical protein
MWGRVHRVFGLLWVLRIPAVLGKVSWLLKYLMDLLSGKCPCLDISCVQSQLGNDFGIRGCSKGYYTLTTAKPRYYPNMIDIRRFERRQDLIQRQVRCTFRSFGYFQRRGINPLPLGIPLHV